MLITGLIIALAVVGAAPFVWSRFREKTLTNAEREKYAPGRTVALSDGAVQVMESGPEDGPVIILIHGFSAPSFVFVQNSDALVKAGFRVIRFDHFGRGWSDRPNKTYDIDFFDREVLDLITALGIREPVGLIGYSMGGIIAAEFAARHPERVAGLCLLAPAGLSLNLYPRGLSRVLLWPLIGDWVWCVRGRDLLTHDPQYDDSSLPPDRRLHGDIAGQFAYRGGLPAILDTWRNLPMQDRDAVFGEAARHGTPVLAVFGARDSVIGPESPERLRAVAPAAQIEVLESGDHALPYEFYDLVNPLVTRFFLEGRVRWDKVHR